MEKKRNNALYGVDVSVHKLAEGFCPLAGDIKAYAKVKRETAKINDIIEECLSKSGCPLGRETLICAAGLLKEGILSLLQRGKSVDVLELGTLAIKAQEGLKSDKINEVDSIDFCLGFTVSKEANDAVKEVGIRSIESVHNEPVIESVADAGRMANDGILTSNSGAIISGDYLRIEGDVLSSGIFIAPVDGAGRRKTSGEDWIRVDKLVENKPKSLMFKMPKYKGKCRIVVKTLYMTRSRRLRRRAVEGVSREVYEVRE